ncbi:LarC family nickel insertion protein [Microbaculum marinum]|uniref:LarC family nickel insertion protein n=1 Tax=Microbaculum marinum TaxID=1764581 RepID=A0AAW9RML4_9HYPH
MAELRDVAERSDGETVSAVHLDAVGGIAGDMFVAAMLDARPDLWCPVEEAVAAMEPPAGLAYRLEDHSDGVLNGMRFTVEEPVSAHSGHHHHTHWRDIRGRIESAPLGAETRRAALGIFAALAEAEAAVHGVDVDDVAFHEVGAWDSIADILAAAAVIATIGPCRWSVGSLPRGSGLVKTAHGMLPVPAPAVVRLLAGYSLVDDGETGERITPTGAAILKFLGATQEPDPVPRPLSGSGFGFGRRTFASRSNVLRATLYAAPAEVRGARGLRTDEVDVLRCEIDDQTGEDLAIALDHIRGADGVLDVCQWPVMGKKGRVGIALQVLVRPDAADRVAAMCLDETTSLGIRRRRERRAIVARESRMSGNIHVKVANRPAGTTAKAEADDIAGVDGHRERRQRREAAEAAVLAGDVDHD